VARALSVARVEVAAAQEAAYLAGAAALAAALKSRGQHFWVYRRPDRPGAFLEFREAGGAADHVSVAPTPQEARLEAALRAVAAADQDAGVMWLEVPLADAPRSADGPG